MLDSTETGLGPIPPADAVRNADVFRLVPGRTSSSVMAAKGFLGQLAVSGSTAIQVVRISNLTLADGAASHLLETVDIVEVLFPADAPESVAGSLRQVPVASFGLLPSSPVAASVVAVIEVDRRMVGALPLLVEAAIDAGYNAVEFVPRVFSDVSDIKKSIFFDRASFNEDLDRAVKAGKRRLVSVRGIKFGSQGRATANCVEGARTVAVVDFDDTGSFSAALQPLRHFDLPATHFANNVFDSQVFISMYADVLARETLVRDVTPTLRAHGLDPELYADVTTRLGIDLRASLASGGFRSLPTLHQAVDVRFLKSGVRAEERLLVDLTKPFIGYNWGEKVSALLPDQYQFRRGFNETQAPVVLVRVSPGRSYELRTTVHDAIPGSAVSDLSVSCNDFTPGDQVLKAEGRHLFHICQIPASAVDDGYLRISYKIRGQGGDGNLATVSLRSLAIEPVAEAPRQNRLKMIGRTLVRTARRFTQRPEADGYGVPIVAELLATDADGACVAAVRERGFARPDEEGTVAAIGLQLARLCRSGVSDDAVEQAIAAGQRVENGLASWIKPSPVQHRYVGTEAAFQLLTLVRAVFLSQGQAEQCNALLGKITERAPTWRPAWLALAEGQIEAGEYDAAIRSARTAVHNDVCCIASQEVLRSAYLARYPKSDKPVIDGVAVYSLKDRFCSVPFDRIETAKDGIVWTCCPAWLGAPIGNMHRSTWEEAWNSDQAALVRQSILEGDYKYCNKGVCPAILGDSLPKKSEVADPHFRYYIDNKIVRLQEGPREVSISHDPSCNLACPQCRNDFILANREKNTEFAATIDPFIKPLIDFAQLDRSVVMMSGDGEIFISPHYNSILKLFDPEKHSQITLNLLSNGLVFEAGWKKVPNIHRLVNRIIISTDAASESAYRKIRGGSWAKLYRGLEFVSGLRKRGEIREFHINYAVQGGNYKDMKRMVEIGLDLGVDRIAFAILRNGGTYDAATYASLAVFEQDHPEHQDFIRELSDSIFLNPIVDVTQFAGFMAMSETVAS